MERKIGGRAPLPRGPGAATKPSAFGTKAPPDLSIAATGLHGKENTPSRGTTGLGNKGG